MSETRHAENKPFELMHELRGDDPVFAGVWNFGFTFRPFFKVFGFTCAGLIVLIVLHYTLNGVRCDNQEDRPMNDSAATPAPPRFRRMEVFVHALAGLGFLVAFGTSFVVEWITGEIEGWAIFLHMFGAGIFLLGMVLVAFVWAGRCRFGVETGLTLGQKLVFWISMVLGLCIMFSMLLAMLPVFGTAGQHVLFEVHEYCGLLFLVVMIVHTVVSLAAKRALR